MASLSNVAHKRKFERRIQETQLNVQASMLNGARERKIEWRIQATRLNVTDGGKF